MIGSNKRSGEGKGLDRDEITGLCVNGDAND